MIFVKAVQDIT